MKPLRFHPSAQRDINGAIAYYEGISEGIAEGFWAEVQKVSKGIQTAPEAHPFDESGLRRMNLRRFPYNELYIIKEDRIRVQVVRHNSRRPTFGVRRSKG